MILLLSGLIYLYIDCLLEGKEVVSDSQYSKGLAFALLTDLCGSLTSSNTTKSK